MEKTIKSKNLFYSIRQELKSHAVSNKLYKLERKTKPNEYRDAEILRLEHKLANECAPVPGLRDFSDTTFLLVFYHKFRNQFRGVPKFHISEKRDEEILPGERFEKIQSKLLAEEVLA